MHVDLPGVLGDLLLHGVVVAGVGGVVGVVGVVGVAVHQGGALVPVVGDHGDQGHCSLPAHLTIQELDWGLFSAAL